MAQDTAAPTSSAPQPIQLPPRPRKVERQSSAYLDAMDQLHEESQPTPPEERPSRPRRFERQSSAYLDAMDQLHMS